MTKIGVLICIIVVILTASVFGAHFGYEVDGVPQSGEGWSLLDGMTYFAHMITFSIDGVPAEISGIFILISLLVVYIIASTVLPGGG